MDFDDNTNRMKMPYDVTTPIENLFEQIDDAVEYADNANTPFTTEQILATSYLLVF